MCVNALKIKIVIYTKVKLYNLLIFGEMILMLKRYLPCVLETRMVIFLEVNFFLKNAYFAHNAKAAYFKSEKSNHDVPNTS